jgi:hypothetical protein
MEPDSQIPGAPPGEAASPDAAHVSAASSATSAGASSATFAATASPSYRRIAWAATAFLAAAIAAAAVWGVQTWRTNRAIANVESSVASRPSPAVAARAAPADTAMPPMPFGPEQTEQPEQGGPAQTAAAAPVTADRLPPLLLPGQPVAAAVLRDLPEWVAADMTPAQTSGASGDESAAPAVPQAPTQPRRERTEAAPRKDRYGAVFARCPGPGESGAVECRRAVCDGAAKKTAACAPYLK